MIVPPASPRLAAEALLFLALFLLLLLPALLNGFPFVMDDSIAYSGQGVNWMRSKTAAVAAAPLYGIVGYWALPIINAAIAASAWISLGRTFPAGRLAFAAIPLSVLALQPIYASAVIVDIWFFGAIVFSIGAMKRSSPFLALLAGILLTAHGSGLILFTPFAIVAAIAFRSVRHLLFAVLSIATALVVTTALDMKYYPDMPRLEKTFLASRLFSADPALLRRECERSGDHALCDGAAFIERIRPLPENAGRRDLFWDMQSRLQPGFDLAGFERNHALPIILDGIRSEPLAFASLIAADFVSFYLPETKFDFTARLNEAMPPAFAQSSQARGVMETAAARGTATVLRYLLYLTAVLALSTRWRAMDSPARRWTVLLLLLGLANDLLFAVVSGPPDRYHHRTLGLIAAAALIAMAAGRHRDA